MGMVVQKCFRCRGYRNLETLEFEWSTNFNSICPRALMVMIEFRL